MFTSLRGGGGGLKCIRGLYIKLLTMVSSNVYYPLALYTYNLKRENREITCLTFYYMYVAEFNPLHFTVNLQGFIQHKINKYHRCLNHINSHRPSEVSGICHTN